MALSSYSTDSEIWAAYDDSASYREVGSVALAKSFETACRILLRRRPSYIDSDGQRIGFDAGLIREELKDAQAYIAGNATPVENGGSGVRHLDASGMRD